MATSKLDLFNDALLLCGETGLASLTEPREARRMLDRAWTNAPRYCLERGQWTFATRAVLLTYSPSLEPDFGYHRAFTKPDDYVRTIAFCSDEFFNTPITRYADEAGFWYAEDDSVYIKYISIHDDFGMDMAKWTATFIDFVVARLAIKIVKQLTGDEKRQASVEHEFKRAKLESKSDDYANKPTQFRPPGAWQLSRWGRRAGNDGGNTSGNLIG